MKKILLSLLLSLAFTPQAFAASPDGNTGPWADSVVSFSQGLTKDGNSVPGDRSDATQALGISETTGDSYDNPVIPGTYFSLGFGGVITLGFDNSIVNGPGADLKVFEVTTPPDYPIEMVKVEASQNGTDWVVIAASVPRDGEVDLGNLNCAQYIRLTDVSKLDDYEDTADAYDLDGVMALHSSQEPCRHPTNACTLTQGYWKNHTDNSAWQSLTDAKFWLSVLKTPVKGRAWYILAHQYVAAKLNVLAGVSPSSQISDAIAKAENLLGNSYHNVSKQDKQQYVDLANLLDSFNQGNQGTSYCD